MTEDLKASPEFHAYLRVRDAVLRIKQAGGAAGGGPSAYWAQELEQFDYLIDASPLIVRKLRQHAFHITNVRPYDYRDKHDGRRESFEARLRALRSLGGDALLVPESPALGGFGYRIGDELFNVDTLKFFEVLIAMERGGVLEAMRGIDRPLVCEVGAGWGGFAYQFKRLVPRTTYVIVDFAELFLFSATYLAAVFPGARMLFVENGDAAALEGWQDADFIFVPHTLSRLVSTLPLNLTVNMVSFQEMTDAQVRGYAAMAATSSCPLLYSLNRERSPYNTELLSVSEALSDWYQLTEVPVLDSDYTSAFRKPPKTPRVVDPNEPRYRHLVGRLDASAREAAQARAAQTPGPAGQGPRVVLGMTLYNNAAHLSHALDSLLAQSYADFALVLLDDASSDGTEAIARDYATRDPRIRYVRHGERQAMIATWREVAEMAAREWPSAPYFAWASDHDWWHPRWLERLVTELDADPQAVLAYPFTRRVSISGAELEKEFRRFDTSSCGDLASRWKHFCHAGIGAGDMVYGVMRIGALRRAGIFRPVLRPDRLLIAELALQGHIHQVPEALWFRRESTGASVDRQPTTLMLPGTAPPWFAWPPWLQHGRMLWREYVTREPRPLPITRLQWIGMLARYQATYGWRHFRRTSTSHTVGRGIDNVVWSKKVTKHWYHRVVYEVLMLTHRLGLRGQRG